MIHVYVELVPWMSVFYVLGCPVGAVARHLWDRRRRRSRPGA